MKASLLIVSVALLIASVSADDALVPALGALKSNIIEAAIHNQQSMNESQPNPAISGQTTESSGSSLYPGSGEIESGGSLGPGSGVSGTFLMLQGVVGEVANVDSHKGWINILAFNYSIKGLRSDTAATQNSGPGDLLLVKPMDRSSPIIYLLAASGQIISQAKLEIMQNGIVTMEYQLDNVMISDAQVIGAGASNGQNPIEAITLTYDNIKWRFVPVDKTTGKQGSPIEAGWDLTLNQAS